ncbi:hypothetical protein [Roseomonas harenae]|nr:hypothetical protein [Roseomonas harenae]
MIAFLADERRKDALAPGRAPRAPRIPLPMAGEIGLEAPRGPRDL